MGNGRFQKNLLDVGQVANWIIKTSAAGAPMTTASSWIRYGVGIDEAQELAQIGTDFAMISARGAWYTFTTFVENKDNPIIKNWLVDNEVELTGEVLKEHLSSEVWKKLSTSSTTTQNSWTFYTTR